MPWLSSGWFSPGRLRNQSPSSIGPSPTSRSISETATSISVAVKVSAPSCTIAGTGLKVTARLDEGVYRKGLKVSRQDVEGLNLRQHETCPGLNYTISPREKRTTDEIKQAINGIP